MDRRIAGSRDWKLRRFKSNDGTVCILSKHCGVGTQAPGLILGFAVQRYATLTRSADDLEVCILRTVQKFWVQSLLRF